MNISRRTLLRDGGLGLLATIVVPCQPVHASPDDQRALDLAQEICTAFSSNRRSAAIVGREYRRLLGAPATVQRLVDEVLPSEENMGTFSRCKDRAARIAMIEDRVRRNFDDGDTVAVHGWVLARTELAVCALCSLVHPDDME